MVFMNSLTAMVVDVTRSVSLQIESTTKMESIMVSMKAFTLIRSEEHTSELQSRTNLVCRLLLEKKKNKKQNRNKMTRIGKPTAKQAHTKTSTI